jgi:anthranilate synthase component 1
MIPLHPTLDVFRILAETANVVPVYTELLADAETPVSLFAKVDQEGGDAFLLESAEHTKASGRYSFIGCRPRVTFTSHGSEIEVVEYGATRRFVTETDPLDELRKLMSRYTAARLSDDPPEYHPPFTGGAVGYLAYDMVQFFEPTVPASSADSLGLPDSYFVLPKCVLIFDHHTRRLRILANAFIHDGGVEAAYHRAVRAIHELMDQITEPGRLQPFPVHAKVEPAVPRSNTSPEAYQQTVAALKEYIRAGDIFQVVPSQRFETDYQGDAATLYRALRFVNPSPYMFIVKRGDSFALVGSSPEVHVRVVNGRIDIRPIAGTKRRGATPKEDAANAAALLADPKERAEHIMLVDLARNDVGRVSEYGSVRVDDLMVIERYSHVMHIVSNVHGELRAGNNAYDVMRATFPAGTVSGSPKVRAMQLINQFEPSKRGVYAGAVGYFGFDGNCDSCIALRTVVLQDGKAYVQAGAGVVADSSPEAEHNECVSKAMGMMAAIGRARQVCADNE